MLAFATVAVLAAGPLGPCAEVAQCTVKVRGAPAPELLAALAELELAVADGAGAEALKRAGGDRAFGLEPEVTPEGYKVRVLSLHRAPSVYGSATVAVAKTKDKFAARAKASAWRQAIERGFEDLTERIKEDLGQGVRKLRLSIRLNGLDQGSRQEIQDRTLACLRSRLDLVGPTTAATERGGFLEEDVEYAPGKGEPREPLEEHVKWVRAALVGGPKAPCTVIGTPLAKYSVLVSSDVLNGGVVVAFDSGK